MITNIKHAHTLIYIYTNCSIFYLVHIGFFSINGTNPWNASFDGMALVANILKSIEVPDRVVFYPLLYSMSL